MAITVNNTGKVSFNYMNKVLEGKAQEQNTPKAEPKKSKYDYSELERRAFLKIANGGE